MKLPIEQYPYRKVTVEVTVPNTTGFRSWLVASAIHMLTGVLDDGLYALGQLRNMSFECTY